MAMIAAITTIPLGGGVQVRIETDRIVLENGLISATFGRESGKLLGIRQSGGSEIVGRADKPVVEARVNGSPLPATFLRPETVAEPGHGTLRLVYSVAEGVLEEDFRLAPGVAELEIRARLRSHSGNRRLEGFRFRLSGISLGDPAAVEVHIPGPWWPLTYVRPGTSYATLAAGPRIDFHSAPDGGFGLVALREPSLAATLVATIDTRGETNARPSLVPEHGRLNLEFTDERAYLLEAGMTVASDPLTLHLIPGTLSDAYHRYRDSLPPLAATPAWVADATILEVYPAYYRHGFCEIAEQLEMYRQVGFNTIYLMPHWTGGYSPIDLYTVDPAYGTEADLKALVGKALALGMRVFFDMVIHGFSDKSPLIREHPEIFVREGAGFAHHPTWKSVTTDWASRAYGDYMSNLARHDARNYGIDGYRVDAASFKGPSWDPLNPEPAYRSGAASPAIMQRTLAGLRETNSEAVLLSEVFGPVFYSVSNFAHDNQTEAIPDLLRRMDRGEATARDYAEHLAAVYDLLPQGANRVLFGRNHDTSWFGKFDGYSPRFLAIEAIHALVGIPEAFAGDPNHGPNPDDDPTVWEHYRRLFALRRKFPELVRGTRELRVPTDDPMIFAAIRRLKGKASLILVSLSDRPTGTRVPTVVRLRDLAGRSVSVVDGRVRLAPFTVATGRLIAP